MFEALDLLIQTNPKYNGAWHCFRTILKQEKFRGLYKAVVLTHFDNNFIF